MALTPEQIAKIKSDPKFGDFSDLTRSILSDELDAREAERSKPKPKSKAKDATNDNTPAPAEIPASFFDGLFGDIFSGDKK